MRRFVDLGLLQDVSSLFRDPAIRVVALPVWPAMAAVAVLVFTFVWSDFFWSLTLAHSSDVRPVTGGLQTLRGMWLTSWHAISGAALIAALPPALMCFHAAPFHPSASATRAL